MASETEPETTYKEAPFADENREEIPVKVHIVAPGTLPEGYVFDAEVGPPGDKKTISVEVVSLLLLIIHRWLLFLNMLLVIFVAYLSCGEGQPSRSLFMCSPLSNIKTSTCIFSTQFYSRINPHQSF